MLDQPRSRAKEQFEETRSKAKEQLPKGRGMSSEEFRAELGDTILDLVEEYFPEQSKARQREHMGRVFVAGVAVGFVLRHLLNR